MGNMEFFIPGTVFGEPLWKLAVRMQIEVLALSCHRVQAYAELGKTLAACRAPDDLLTEQVRFWQIAQRQYIASLDKVFSPPSPAAGETRARVEKTPAVRDYMVVPERPSATNEPERRSTLGPQERTATVKEQAAAPEGEERQPPVRVRRSA